jgi:hypothetical protein
MIAVDTNVLIYACDQLAPYWHQQLSAANNPIADNIRTSSSVSSRPSTVIRCEAMEPA